MSAQVSPQRLHQLRVAEAEKYINRLRETISTAVGAERVFTQEILFGAESVFDILTASLEELLPEDSLVGAESQVA